MSKTIPGFLLTIEDNAPAAEAVAAVRDVYLIYSILPETLKYEDEDGNVYDKYIEPNKPMLITKKDEAIKTLDISDMILTRETKNIISLLPNGANIALCKIVKRDGESPNSNDMIEMYEALDFAFEMTENYPAKQVILSGISLDKSLANEPGAKTLEYLTESSPIFEKVKLLKMIKGFSKKTGIEEISKNLMLDLEIEAKRDLVSANQQLGKGIFSDIIFKINGEPAKCLINDEEKDMAFKINTTYKEIVEQPVYFTCRIMDGENEIKSEQVEMNTEWNPTVDEKQGYTFVGLFVNKEMTEKLVTPVTVVADMTVYAKFEKILLDFTCKVMDGETVLISEVVKENSTWHPTPIKQGFTLIGIYNEVDFQTEATLPMTITSDVTLYAKFQENPKPKPKYICKVMDGETEMLSEEIEKGNQWNPTVSKDNHEFKGYYKEKEFTTKVETPVTINEATTLYAKFELIPPPVVKHTCKVMDGDTALIAVEVEENQQWNPAPEKAGFTLEGLYLEAEFTTKVTLPITVTKDETLYSKWTEDASTISLYAVGDVIDVEFTVDGLTTPTGNEENKVVVLNDKLMLMINEPFKIIVDEDHVLELNPGTIELGSIGQAEVGDENSHTAIMLVGQNSAECNILKRTLMHVDTLTTTKNPAMLFISPEPPRNSSSKAIQEYVDRSKQLINKVFEISTVGKKDLGMYLTIPVGSNKIDGIGGLYGFPQASISTFDEYEITTLKPTTAFDVGDDVEVYTYDKLDIITLKAKVLSVSQSETKTTKIVLDKPVPAEIIATNTPKYIMNVNDKDLNGNYMAVQWSNVVQQAGTSRSASGITWSGECQIAFSAKQLDELNSYKLSVLDQTVGTTQGTVSKSQLLTKESSQFQFIETLVTVYALVTGAKAIGQKYVGERIDDTADLAIIKTELESTVFEPAVGEYITSGYDLTLYLKNTKAQEGNRKEKALFINFTVTEIETLKALRITARIR